jgi:hypothetical protein
MAIELEKKLDAFHLAQAATFGSGAQRALFEAMMRSDDGHVAKLEAAYAPFAPRVPRSVRPAKPLSGTPPRRPSAAPPGSPSVTPPLRPSVTPPLRPAVMTPVASPVTPSGRKTGPRPL